jgi:pimeloyl-ACP methyl ester carboxylesterase
MDSPDAAARHSPKSPVFRRRNLLAAGAAGLISALGLAALIPEHILFRQRLLFSILDLGSNVSLKPFDHHTHDGLTLRSWFKLPADSKPTIVYFAGRDGDLVRKPAHLFALAQEGYGLLLAGYRGYGGNPGWPSERTMFLDAAALLGQAELSGLTPNGYISYGYSMGSAIACSAAVQVRPRALILEAPISRFIEAVRQHAAHVPAWLVRTQFDNKARVADLSVPILLIAGGRDAVTPPVFALSLAAANEPFSTVRIVEEANHVNIIRLGGGTIVREFLETLMEQATDQSEGQQVQLETDGAASL